MNQMTGGELLAARKALEKAAASLLGEMLFEFARLDLALGLCIVWTDEGRNYETLTNKVSNFPFHNKLESLNKSVEKALVEGSEERAAYLEWIQHAHTSRLLRNDLVHGRWVVDPHQQQAINVNGLPNSPEVRETRYSLHELEAVLEEMKRLQVRLNELRHRWPV